MSVYLLILLCIITIVSGALGFSLYDEGYKKIGFTIVQVSVLMGILCGIYMYNLFGD